MKQVVRRGGQSIVAEMPAPGPQPGYVLVATAASVVSSGTERASVGSGGGGLVGRAFRNPDLVKKAITHLRDQGVRATAERVRGATADDYPIGYSCAGTLLDTGGIPQFRVGQLVACAGAGHANHAEIVSVPGNLVAPVPDGVSARDAAFTTLGAIAIQGVRRAQPTLGERVVVVGLGLLGLLTVQLARAAGCAVAGVEPVKERRDLATSLGAELVVAPGDAAGAVESWTSRIGADAVIITAAGASDAILNNAVELLRRKGRVVPVGDVGLNIERAGIYRREADVLISTSYGPGRYDQSYEEAGVDYPIEYVRWTENRNMEEFLRLVGNGSVRVEPLVGLELEIDSAADAYTAISGENPPIGVVLTYPDAEAAAASAAEAPRRTGGTGSTASSGTTRVGIVGAGAFVRATHLPNLRREIGVDITVVASRTGTSAGNVARIVDARAETGWQGVVDDPDVDLVLVGTRHDTHAEIAAAALRAGKAVFLEKPLGLSRDEIDDVWAAGGGADARLAIGFNRPFAPLARKLGDAVRALGGPVHLIYRVSAPLPAGHWLNDAAVGGGRVLGEACHMYDFANWLGGTPQRVLAAALPSPDAVGAVESTSTTITYENGSVGTVHYSGVGAGSMPKERIEVLAGGRSWVLDDFRTLTEYGAPGSEPTVEDGGGQNKGHAALLSSVLAATRGQCAFEPGLGPAYVAQSVALAALESIASGATVEVRQPATNTSTAAAG